MNKTTNTISEGMIVRYSDAWSLPGERKYLFVVQEAFPDVERCHIKCINSTLTFAPTEIVDFKMVTPTGFNINERSL